jgi:hypothetical protein
VRRHIHRPRRVASIPRALLILACGLAVAAGPAVAAAPTRDTTPPDTQILGQGSVDPTSASIVFGGTDPDDAASSLTFECSLDGRKFADCTSPVTYTTLAFGSHTFRVAAEDPARNADETPATFSWSAAPDAVEGSFPPAGGSANTAGTQGATTADVTTTSVNTSVGGGFGIDETDAGGSTDCGGFGNCIGQLVRIAFDQRPPATGPYPFTFVFTFDRSVVLGRTLSSLHMLHDGVQVPNCTASLKKLKQQCVDVRSVVGDGDYQLRVLAQSNGSWRGR